MEMWFEGILDGNLNRWKYISKNNFSWLLGMWTKFTTEVYIMFCPQWPTGQSYFYFFPWMWISIAMIRNNATDAATMGRRYMHLLQWHSLYLLLHCHADLIAQGKVSSTKHFLLGSISGWHTCPYRPNIARSASCLWVRGEYTIYCDQISAERKRMDLKQSSCIVFTVTLKMKRKEGQICTVHGTVHGKKRVPFIFVSVCGQAVGCINGLCVICEMLRLTMCYSSLLQQTEQRDFRHSSSCIIFSSCTSMPCGSYEGNIL